MRLPLHFNRHKIVYITGKYQRTLRFLLPSFEIPTKF